MTSEIAEIIKSCTWRPALPSAIMDAILKRAPSRLPDDYLALMTSANGFTGQVGRNYVDFWPLENVDVFGRRATNAGLLFFGSDGGGEGFAFDTSTRGLPIVWTPFIGSEPANIVRVADTVTAFLRRLLKTHLFDLRNR